MPTLLIVQIGMKRALRDTGREMTMPTTSAAHRPFEFIVGRSMRDGVSLRGLSNIVEDEEAYGTPGVDLTPKA